MKNNSEKRTAAAHGDRKTRIWIIALAALCLVCVVGYVIAGAVGTGTVAVVRVDGEELYRIDLSRVTAEYDIDIDTRYGHNTVHVAPGNISVTAADCPDGVCVAQGAISRGGVPIICMPHHLSVRIEGGGIDA